MDTKKETRLFRSRFLNLTIRVLLFTHAQNRLFAQINATALRDANVRTTLCDCLHNRLQECRLLGVRVRERRHGL